MGIEALQTSFSSSLRSAGALLFKASKVSFSKPSSLEVTAYVKPSYRVGLKLVYIDSKILNANCNCGPSKKGQLCKHIWATILAVTDKSPDFIEEINEVSVQLKSKPSTPLSEIQALRKENFKLKQAIYRKELYQKQKARSADFKSKQKSKSKQNQKNPAYPIKIEAAMKYFSNNGFNFDEGLNEAAILLARKKLSRVFHPDIGGSHEEILELNSQTEVLLKFIAKHDLFKF